MKMSKTEFLDWPNKVITLIGMSGVGKTTLASKLPASEWFHYSADYRIGTRYLNEPILDNIKKHALEQPFLKDLLLSNSISFRSNITFHHLKPVATFLGKIGSPEFGGISIDEFKRRQHLHRDAEARAIMDVGDFIHKSREIYGRTHFLNDTGGSVCELSDEEAWKDLARSSIILYIKADQTTEETMIERARQEPKPMYYDDDFIDTNITEYLAANGLSHVSDMKPEKYMQWVFPRLIAHRRPLYERIANTWGYTIPSDTIFSVNSQQDVMNLISEAL